MGGEVGNAVVGYLEGQLVEVQIETQFAHT